MLDYADYIADLQHQALGYTHNGNTLLDRFLTFNVVDNQTVNISFLKTASNISTFNSICLNN